jgi:hypothetical protein
MLVLSLPKMRGVEVPVVVGVDVPVVLAVCDGALAVLAQSSTREGDMGGMR